MSAIEHLKHLPRWTYLTAAGVSVGAIGIKLWKGRAAPDPTQTPSDGTSAGDAYSGSVQPATTGSSPPGVIVPPIITGGDGASASDLGAAFASLVGGTIDNLTGLVGTVLTGDQANMNALIGNQGAISLSAIDLLAGAGTPPQPVIVNPTPVVVNMPKPSTPPRVTNPPTPTNKAAAAVPYISAAINSIPTKSSSNADAARRSALRSTLTAALNEAKQGNVTRTRADLTAARATAEGTTKDHINRALNAL